LTKAERRAIRVCLRVKPKERCCVLSFRAIARNFAFPAGDLSLAVEMTGGKIEMTGGKVGRGERLR